VKLIKKMGDHQSLQAGQVPRLGWASISSKKLTLGTPGSLQSPGAFEDSSIKASA
jgi:hypothetical protein